MKPYYYKMHLIFMSLIISVGCIGQTTLSIEYERLLLTDTTKKLTGFLNKEHHLKMIVNDSFALTYFFEKDNDLYINKRTKTIGNKLIPHGVFFDFSNKVRYHEVNLSKQNRLLYTDSGLTYQWQFLDIEKTILSHQCKAALAIKSNNDSILVWYTHQLKFKQGGLLYDGIPGVVLQVDDQSVNWEVAGGVRFSAIKIREQNIVLARPTGYPIFTEEEFIKEKKAWDR